MVEKEEEGDTARRLVEPVDEEEEEEGKVQVSTMRRPRLLDLSRQRELGASAKRWESELERRRQLEATGQVALRAQGQANPLILVNNLMMRDREGEMSSVTAGKFVLTGLYGKRKVCDFDVSWTTPLPESEDEGEWGEGPPRLGSPHLEEGWGGLSVVGILPEDESPSPPCPSTPPPSPFSDT